MPTSLAFLCPNCSAKLAIAEDVANDRVECPGCRVAMLVPDGELAGDVSPTGLAIAEEAPVDFHAKFVAGDAEMDMTPMVDVTFLLLIFFMITATFSLQRSFQIPAPEEDRPSTEVMTVEDFEDDPDFVVVRVDENSTFYISAAGWDDEREAPSQQDLLVGLRDARRVGPGGSVPSQLLVLAHGDAMHEKVVMAMDAGNDVGMDKVKLVTVDDNPW